MAWRRSFFRKKTVKKDSLGMFNGNQSELEFQLLVNQCHPQALWEYLLVSYRRCSYLFNKKPEQCLGHSEVDTNSALKPTQRNVSSCNPSLRGQPLLMAAFTWSRCAMRLCPCRWLLWAEAQVAKLSVDQAFSRKYFSCGLRQLKSNQSILRLHLFRSGAWQIGHSAISSLSWEVATCPLQQLLPEAIHHHVSSKPSLVPFYGSEAKERHIPGREEQTYMSWGHALKCVLFSECMTTSEHPPLTHRAGTGWHNTRPTGVQLIVPSRVRLGTAGMPRPWLGRGNISQSSRHLQVICWFPC